ncbi:MAG: hypothetical protein IJ234_07470 [Clostridia bacterium]|nr:hypothetical protein [Clostridia bacterium]
MPEAERGEWRLFAYCYFCNTVKCAAVANAIAVKYGFKAITPKIIQRKWMKGTPTEAVHDYLPGYVFVYTQEAQVNPRELCRIDGVLRCLGERELNYVLTGTDLDFANMLLGCDGTIGILKAYQEGDRVRLAKNALGGFEGEIIKLDRRRGRAQIQYSFDGISYKVWVGYELIEESAQ